MRRLFVLRPEPGLSATMARGAKMGLDMMAMPMSRAEPVAWDAPETSAFDGLLIGSANALRHGGAALKSLTSLPIYAVGATTAREAEALGFRPAHVGEGGLQSVIDALPNEKLRLLRLAGEDHVPLHTPDMIEIETRVVYRICYASLSAQDAAKLGEGGIVLLHSAKAAEHFASQCAKADLARENIALAALSPRIARVMGVGWAAVRSAPQPSDAALLSMARDMCH